ncbi:MAG: hypothetical protein CSA11_03160 [Chloroflexi bacterium]|nr:MAG: hypothetical protein CSA11_03160 [Chloroflexota bacterium]
MLRKRAVIALTLGSLALYLVYLGGWFYFIPITAVLLLATYEFTNMMRKIGVSINLWLLLTAVFLLLLGNQIPNWPANLLTLMSLMLFMSYSLWLYEKEESQTAVLSWMTMMGGFLFFGWVGNHFLLLRDIEVNAWQWTIIALISTWSADSGAYLIGRFMAGNILGRHPLAPRLSPNKTIEGYIGGIIFGSLFTVGTALLLQLPWLPALIIGLLASIIGPLGDLGMSLIKRESNVKDSGRIFGAHGGAIDRVDSLIWSVAMAYYVLFLFA